MFLRAAAFAALLFTPLHAQAPARAAAAAPLPDARTLVNRHIQAIGGREAILAHKSVHATGTLTIASAGISGPVEMFQASDPDRSLLKATIPGIGEIADGYDGTHAWAVNPMTGPVLKAGKELAQAQLDADFYGELRDPKKYTLQTIEKTTFGGRECYKVSVKRTDGSEDFDFYDVATGLRAGSINTRESQMGPVTTTSLEGDYKPFGKLTQATSLTVQTMGVEQKITVSTVEYDKVQPSVFEPPAAIKALIK